MDEILGRVTAAGGSQIGSSLEAGHATHVGSLVKIRADDRDVIGSISAIERMTNALGRNALVIDLLGEVVRDADGRYSFQRGTSRYPTVGTPVFRAADTDLRTIYAQPAAPALRVGAQYDDPSHAAYVATDELLGKHFAVLGTTGSGKSCTVALILSALLAQHPNAHVLLLDPHNEYASAFGDLAEVITVDNLRLPIWLLDFEEACRALIRGGTPHEQEAQAMILKDAIAWARRNQAGNDAAARSITVDTPVPYAAADLIRFINEEMGRLGRPDTVTPYLRLRTRIESLRDDRRFAFMFSRLTTDGLSEIVGRFLRIPVAGKPLSIVDLSGLPSEITDVVVSMIARTIFDFALWADRAAMPPLLLVCEEAQRYVPADERVGFAATARAISRIAKEGRKYGLSLALVTQRPSEISPHALSQCGTVFAMRLGEDLDQQFVSRLLPDTARGMLAELPSLPPRQAIVAGEGVAMTMRVRFDDLPPERLPRSSGSAFSQAWQSDAADEAFRDAVVERWRLQKRDWTR